MDAKSIAVICIVVGCLVVVYPKIFHPMIKRALGFGEKTNADKLDKNGMPHAPKMRPGPMSDRHMMGGTPHPGMRAAAEMRKQAMETQGSGRGGMVTMMLPVYTIGIVIYLIYTLCKIFNKDDSKSGGRKNNVWYTDKLKSFTEEDSDEVGDEDYAEYIRKKKRQRELDIMLNKADERKISDYEMLQLQEKLLETEAQMQRIVDAMKQVQGKMTTVGSETVAQMSQGAGDSGSTEQLSKNQETDMCEPMADKLEQKEENALDQISAQGASFDQEEEDELSFADMSHDRTNFSEELGIEDSLTESDSESEDTEAEQDNNETYRKHQQSDENEENEVEEILLPENKSDDTRCDDESDGLHHLRKRQARDLHAAED
ncbi:resistance to inhibitors of cholinesterase protein 3 [Lingula anatina]|uniref:Resistance to inhibitors of cholinesterase protein 3 n=1 Tax=Lingula anatina TaxID=7574 RepID=A0A1S3IGT7_LINAN|nr:resistance to inhibitors of cholinesterase protein 3 [Lingula anatina]|eukprot:XP_013396689.1 resistance to inhibitors of cholinesterase protein 3 [Lingula anatina]